MKKNLLITLLLIPFVGVSQTPKSIEGFLGIKFGASPSEVLAALKAKDAKYEKDNSCCGQLAFSDVKFGPRTAYLFLINFVIDKAYEVEYTFAPQEDAKVIEEYNQLVANITDVYGPGRVTTKYSSTFKADDGDTLHGLSEGQIDFHTYWLDATNNVVVIVKIDSTMRVTLTYKDVVLFKLAIKNHMEPEISDN